MAIKAYGPNWWDNFSDAVEVEKVFGIKYKGPGIYCTGDNTLLILPVRAHGPATAEDIWDAEQPSQTMLHVAVYNEPYEETILSVMKATPIYRLKSEGGGKSDA